MKTVFPLLCWLACVPLNASQAEAERPNIVFIMADDLGYRDIGCYGQKLIATPRIDRLASEGTRFMQAYAGGPVCTSSRSVVMTGLHTGHTPARDNVPHYNTYLDEDDVTVAEILTDAGYRCGGIGKWSLGDAGTVGQATNQGFHNWFGYLNQDHAHYYFTDYLDDDEGRHAKSPISDRHGLSRPSNLEKDAVNITHSAVCPDRMCPAGTGQELLFRAGHDTSRMWRISPLEDTEQKLPA